MSVGMTTTEFGAVRTVCARQLMVAQEIVFQSHFPGPSSVSVSSRFATWSMLSKMFFFIPTDSTRQLHTTWLLMDSHRISSLRQFNY